MAHINFSGFKLVHRDEKKAILKKGGHEFHISIGNLHPKNKEELDKLELHRDAAKHPSNNPKLAESKKVPPKADNGVRHYAEGTTDVQPIDVDTQNVQLPENLAPLDNMSPGAGFAAAQPQQMSPLEQSLSAAPQFGVTAEDIAQAQPPTQETPSAPSAPIPTSTQAPNTPPSTQMPSSPGMPQPGDYASQIAQATKGENAANMAAATAQGQMGIDQAAQATAAAEAEQKLSDHVQQSTAHISNEINNVVQDIQNGHINPSRYMSSMSTENKIASGIGLILGGIGSGISGGPNMALDFLNKQIDRDIEGQKAEMNKKENLVNLYSKMLGNEREGAVMASNALAHITANKILAAGAASNDQMVRQRAQAAAQGLIAQRLPEMQKLAYTQGSMNMMADLFTGSQQAAAKGAPSWDSNKDMHMQTLIGRQMALDPAKAKEISDRYVPGVGISAIPVEKSTRDSLVAHKELDDAAKDLLDFANKHTGSFDPRVVATGAQKAQLLQSKYRESVFNTVYKAGEQPLLEKVVGNDPTSIWNHFGNIPKIEEIIRANERNQNTIKKTAGLPVSQPQQQQAPGRILHNPKTGEKIQLVNGQWQKI